MPDLADAERISRRIVVRNDQRILPHEAVRQMQIDVCSSFGWRQRAAVALFQVVEINVVRCRPDSGNANLDRWAGGAVTSMQSLVETTEIIGDLLLTLIKSMIIDNIIIIDNSLL